MRGRSPIYFKIFIKFSMYLLKGAFHIFSFQVKNSFPHIATVCEKLDDYVEKHLNEDFEAKDVRAITFVWKK